MRAFVLGVVAAMGLAGCVEEEPPKPPQALLVLQAACDKGDTQACAQVLAYEQRRQAMRQQAGAQLMNDMQAAQKPIYTYQMPTTQVRHTSCAPGFGGYVNCTSY